MPAGDGVPAESAQNARFDAAKARRAAKSKRRVGQNCGGDAGQSVPVVDRNRCEGKAECVAVCPYGVFEVRRIADEDFRALSFLGRLKSRAHGRQTAYVSRPSDCRSCGLCVAACPERALTLVSPKVNPRAQPG